MCKSAFRHHQHRNKKALQSNNDVTSQKHLGNTEIEKETEIELEKEIDTETDKEGVGVVFDKYSELGFGAMNLYKAV